MEWGVLMARYIDRDRLLTALQDKQQFCLSTYSTGRMFFAMDNEIIKEQPTADVVEVKHGYWEMYEDESLICATEFSCSICNESFCSSDLTEEQMIEMLKYCPNCGAKMDGE